MRLPLLPAVLLALAAGACSSAGPTARPADADPPAHQLPTLRPEPRLATPYDGVTFEDPGTNPFVDAAEDRESTFGLDVDTASYTIARRWIEDGNLPDPASIRATDPAFQLDALVAAAAERLRDSRWGRRYDLRDVLEVADEVGRGLPATPETDDFLALLEAAARLER